MKSNTIFQSFLTIIPIASGTIGQVTGLGLPLAYDIVKAHGGEIRVHTNEGEGSVFIVSIPLQ